ncbi:MAG: glycoside hydrolase family 97 protein, partial [Flavobacteriia bacterium]
SMGFDFKDQASLKNHLKIIGSTPNTVNETWEMPWGEQKDVVNHYNELKVELEETQAPNRKFNIYFRAYDDGIGFRYEFLPQQGIDSIIIMDENTEFQLTEDYTTFWIPGDWDIYEHLYNTSKVSEIDAIAKRNNADLAQSNIPENAVNTPVTMRSDSGLHLSFHEANLTDYAGMTLKVDNETLKLTSELVGSDRLGYKVKRALPFKTPWRTIQIADKATELIDSKLIVNLNEPNKIGDVSWFKPKKYVGIWWEMHIGKSTWDYAASQDMNSFTTDAKPHGKHGATTENTKHYIDFAAKNNITGVLVEGWNTGWEHWIGFEDREGVFDFITPYPDYDLEEVTRYGKEKGVELIMHHETSAAPRTYEQQLDTAYQLMHKLGIHSVKTGYVGKIIPKGEYHHGQWMVNHYRKVVETGAKYQVAVNAHEPIKATGLRRTYPNVIAREGLRGQEFNAWASDGGNPPEHLPIVAFTRMLAGPIDFTPGVFDIALPSKPNNQINTTLAQQLALYVVIYSPIQMACDLPENYEDQPAFQFIRDVGVDWDQTVVLNGEVGDFVTIARKERETGNWFVGGISDENARDLNINFDFLDEGVEYEATIYKDAPDANYKDNPTAISIEKIEVNKGSDLSVHLAEGGGFAISLMKRTGS